jgi:hypothetical protein
LQGVLAWDALENQGLELRKTVVWWGEWFPTLRDATATQRNNWRLIGRGVGIHWEDLDEDISVAGLLAC